MPAETTIAADTLCAYRDSDYHVHADPPFILRVGTVSDELRVAHQRYGVTCSAYLTACNPYSRIVDDAENTARMRALSAELARHGHAFVAGVGRHPDGGWPGEDSVLVFGLDLVATRALGVRFEQNAVLWIDADALPQLILLR